MAKKLYVGVNNVARKAKKLYIGAETDIPIYSEGPVTKTITDSNIADVFSITNGSYKFTLSGSSFVSNNNGQGGTTAETVLTAKVGLSAVSFSYAVSSEPSYDKLTIKVNGATVVNAISGTSSGTWNGSMNAGQTIVMQYAKDGSVNKNNDNGTISNISVSYTGQTQTGTERREVARNIVKGYIGIGGVARPFWTRVGTLAYYGKVSSTLSGTTKKGAATHVGGYALFFNTIDQNERDDDDEIISEWTDLVINAYNSSLTKSATKTITNRGYYGAVAHVGNYAIHAGGIDADSTRLDNVDYINSSLTTGTCTKLSKVRYLIEATSVGDYAIFAGGYNNSTTLQMTTVDAYSSSLTKTTISALSKGVEYHAATHVGGYALIGGGSYDSTKTNIMNAYDTSLTKVTAPNLSQSMSQISATHIGDYAIFAGGGSAVVNAYSSSLVRSNPTSMSGSRGRTFSTHTENYAIIAGSNSSNDTAVRNGIEVYDASLTKVASDITFSKTMSWGHATHIGNYALFTDNTTIEAICEI